VHAFMKVDVVRVKGKETPVAIYEPLGPKDASPNRCAGRRRIRSRVCPLSAQDWDAAESALRTLNARAPRTLYDIYLERIAHFRAERPGWLGWRVRLHHQIASHDKNSNETHILGCSGGIGSGRHTTCLKVDDDILIRRRHRHHTLDFEQLLAIDHVFLTHAHLDHVLGLPLLLDSVGDLRTTPLTVHALPEVLEVLSAHLFNWHLWPDFREIPSPESPWLQFAPWTLARTSRSRGERSGRCR